jgi:hypothetical protein
MHCKICTSAGQEYGMTRQLRPLDELGVEGVKSTFLDGGPYDLTFAGGYCIISAGSPIHLAFAANKLTVEGGWVLHGSPVHDGNRFHQWMVKRGKGKDPSP